MIHPKKMMHNNHLKPAMTMVELLVAVAVLAILIMIFGRILSQSQKVVTNSQALMSFNAGGSAASNVLRQDILSINTNGFLCIIDNTSDYNYPNMKMYIGAEGSFQSWCDPSVNGGAFIGIGLCNQNSKTNIDDPKVLWRARWVMSASSPSPSATTDYWHQDFSAITSLADPKRSNLFNNWISVINNPSNNYVPDNLNVPPSNITEVQTVWKYLVPNITKLSIMWTKGDYDINTKTLIWYGRDIDGHVIVPGSTSPAIPSNGSIITYTNAELNNTNPTRKFNDSVVINSGIGTTALNAVYTVPASGGAVSHPEQFMFYSGNNFYSFWNSELSSTYWPTAIKITYVVTDGDPANPITKTYEIICTINN